MSISRSCSEFACFLESSDVGSTLTNGQNQHKGKHQCKGGNSIFIWKSDCGSRKGGSGHELFSLYEWEEIGFSLHSKSNGRSICYMEGPKCSDPFLASFTSFSSGE